MQTNLYGNPLSKCSSKTGWTRSGYCDYYKEDGGRHLVCATMTKDFLDFTKKKGNDFSSVVNEGENWCICEGRYKEAKIHGKEPPVVFKATNKKANVEYY